MSGDPWERAPALNIAVLLYGDPERVARYHAVRERIGSRRPVYRSRWLEDPRGYLDEREDPRRAAMQDAVNAEINEKDALWRALVRGLIQRLRRGELVAQGIQSPPTLDSEPVVIPTKLWRILKPDLRDSSAEAEGLRFAAVRVLRADTMTARAPERESRSAAAERLCGEWLRTEAQRGSVMKRGDAESVAYARFRGLTTRGFDRAWKTNAAESWKQPGRRKRPRKSPQ